MRCVIKDKATPKTGGVTNQCPSNHHQIERAPKVCILLLNSGFSPIMQNKPNPTSPTAQKYETNPIYRPTTQMCETNPIPEGPNPQDPCTGTACRAPILRNEPNLPTARLLPARPHLDYAKRTQFPPSRPADNPNMRNEPNLHPEKMRNDPNSRIPSVPPPPISAKRTQSTLPPPGHTPNVRNEPNFHPAARPTTQNMRNEPNLPYGHGMPCPKNAKRTQSQHPRPATTNQIGLVG